IRYAYTFSEKNLFKDKILFSAKMFTYLTTVSSMLEANSQIKMFTYFLVKYICRIFVYKNSSFHIKCLHRETLDIIALNVCKTTKMFTILCLILNKIINHTLKFSHSIK